MTNSIDLLVANSPSWVKIGEVRKDRFTYTARSKGNTYDLETYEEKNIVSVKEQTPGTNFPKVCPERHIEYPDGTFCTGRNIGKSIRTGEQAINWWNSLEQFLRDQNFSAKHKYWPPGRALSHGTAADRQLDMEKTAKLLDEKSLFPCKNGTWSEEVFNAINFKTGWLSGTLPRIRKNSKGMLVNQRCPCPRGCATRKRWIKRRRCPEREAVASIVSLETERRRIEQVFVEILKKKGFTCCGSMRTCPFKKRKEKNELDKDDNM